MIVSLFGPPGAGKSSVGDWLATQHGLLHLALGRVLKDEAQLEAIGVSREDARHAVQAGRTINSEPLLDWLDRVICAEARPIVVDGYPRVPNALARFNRLVEELAPSRVAIALHLRCTVATSFARMRARGRSDDTPKLLAARYEEYERVQLPLLSGLSPSVRIAEIDARAPVEEVRASVAAALDLPLRSKQEPR